MRQSKLFTKTRKEPPSDEVSRNAQLLIQAGFIHKELAGAYAYLPLGHKVLDNVQKIIRDEMKKISGQELELTALQNPEIWKQTDRWSDDVIDVWFKTRLHKGDQFHQGKELGLGNTHEEPLTNIMTQHIDSYKDLPKYIFQIQTKFRNEVRAKSGILRGREFLMKDLYSFCKDQKHHQEFYQKAKQAYVNIFNRSGIGEDTYFTFASGGSFSKYSHEFQTLTEAGEDVIYICEDCEMAINEEIIDDQDICPECGKEQSNLREEKAVEVGNIFTLGTRFSEPLGLTYTDENSEEKPVFMGSYGIGCGRLMGTIVEVHNDENGIIWPEEISPFDLHLISIVHEDEEIEKADDIYNKLKESGAKVLYDDRTDSRAGEKFADSDLIGIPARAIISSKNLDQNQIEIEDRETGETEYMKIDEFISSFK